MKRLDININANVLPSMIFFAIYLSEERLKWAKTFPDIFYILIYKLKGWPYPSGSKEVRYIGKITNKLIYDKLPDGVLPELRRLNPVNPETKRRSAKHLFNIFPKISDNPISETTYYRLLFS